MSYKILIADDDRNIVELLKLSLEKEGYKVFTAYDGSSALEKVEKYRPDLAIFDVVMPGMDGYDVTYLSTIAPNYRPKVIILTVKTKELDRMMGKSMGADVYMTKPFDINELKIKIQELLTAEKK